MTWSIGKKIGAGYVLALLISVIIGVVGYRNIDALIETSHWVIHTNVVLREIDLCLSILQDTETGQRGYIITGVDSYLDPYSRGSTLVRDHIKMLRELTKDNPRQQQRLDALEPLVIQKLDELRETIDLRREEGFDAAVSLVGTGKGKTIMDNIRKVLQQMIDEERKLLDQRTKVSEANAQKAEQTIVFCIIIAIVILSLAGFLITRGITKPLEQIVSVSTGIASGDLTMNVSTDGGKDEIGILARSFAQMLQSLKDKVEVAKQISEGNLKVTAKPASEKDVLGVAFATMVENLRSQTAEILEGVSALATSASEISASVQQLASSTSETATSVSETSTTMEEVKQTALVSNEKARYVSDSAQKAKTISQDGKKAADDTAEGMRNIQEQMESIGESIMSLSEQSQAIGEIISSVDDIADQSNLLAVNASIEAVKAGEHGKGFTVVAQEIKSLSEQSKQATLRVRTILNDIQKAMGNAVMVTEQGSKTVDAGVKQSAQAGESILALSDSITEAAQAATQIAASSQQQFVGIEQVATAMQSVKKASSQNSASVKQLGTTAQNLSDLGQKLKKLTERYIL